MTQWPRYYDASTFPDGTHFVYRWESDHTPPLLRSRFGGWAKSAYDPETFAASVQSGALKLITDEARIAELTPQPEPRFTPIAANEIPAADAAAPDQPAVNGQYAMGWHPRSKR